MRAIVFGKRQNKKGNGLKVPYKYVIEAKVTFLKKVNM